MHRSADMQLHHKRRAFSAVCVDPLCTSALMKAGIRSPASDGERSTRGRVFQICKTGSGPARNDEWVQNIWTQKLGYRYLGHPECPRGLTFTWWGCGGLCFWHKPTELAHSFLFCSYAYFCLYSSFNCISFYELSRQLAAFSICSSGLTSAFLVLSTLCLFMKFSCSPDRILCVRLGLKCQLTY